jgi:hypothetical protein
VANMIGDDNELVDLKRRCVPLVIHCPRRDVGEGCPFHEIRKIEVMERVNWVKGMTEEKLRALLVHHANCMQRRLGNPALTKNLT